MPRHPYLSKQAVQSGQNIVLRANFDPGWERLQRENGFEVLPRSDLAKELLQQPYALVECYSANEILQHARNIKQRAEDLSVFDNVYVSASKAERQRAPKRRPGLARGLASRSPRRALRMLHCAGSMCRSSPQIRLIL